MDDLQHHHRTTHTLFRLLPSFLRYPSFFSDTTALVQLTDTIYELYVLRLLPKVIHDIALTLQRDHEYILVRYWFEQ